jgi:hypothetical protein
VIYKVKPNLREKGIEAHLVKLVKERRGMCKKVGTEGWPDRLVILPHVVPFFVETKSKTGKLSQRQAYVKRDLEARGVVVHVPYSKADVDALLGFEPFLSSATEKYAERLAISMRKNARAEMLS